MASNEEAATQPIEEQRAHELASRVIYGSELINQIARRGGADSLKAAESLRQQQQALNDELIRRQGQVAVDTTIQAEAMQTSGEVRGG